MSIVVLQHGHGGPGVLDVTTREIAAPGAGEVSLRQEAIGLNFIDILLRNGTFPVAQESVNGVEAAGVITAIGSGVSGFAPGDRVAYHFSPGAYAAERLISADALVQLPDGISTTLASAALTKGLTARMAVKNAYQVKPGDVLIVTSAAGGVGSLVVRWATALGATVVGVVGSEAKRQIALDNGATAAVVGHQALAPIVDSLTSGTGATALLDGVGGRGVSELLASVRPGGSVVSFGSANGRAQPDRTALRRQQLSFSSPDLGQFVAGQRAVQAAADDLFAALERGDLGELPITTRPLAEVAAAHRDLEGRRTTGSTVLLP